MQPSFERLRAIARYGDDDRVLVAEAADCLADFDDDPAALVVTCRRLLAHHPECAPMWWVCARVLTAPEPSEAAWESEERVRSDPTAARLAALLPFPADHPIAVLGWPDLAGDALASRPDLEALAVRGATADPHWERRLARSDAIARPVDLTEALAAEVSHVLVDAVAASGERVLVRAGTTHVLDTLARPGLLVWLVAGVGRVLPNRLFDAMARLLGDPDDPFDDAWDDRGLELLDVQRFDRVAGPTGLDRPDQVVRRADCPVAPELLRIS
jgi:hypothetical protein